MTLSSLVNRSRFITALRYGERIRPVRDWFVILGGSVIVLAASAAGNVWIFVAVAQGEVIGSAALPTDTPNGSIEAVRELFETRAVEKMRYENDYRFIDPSR